MGHSPWHRSMQSRQTSSKSQATHNVLDSFLIYRCWYWSLIASFLFLSIVIMYCVCLGKGLILVLMWCDVADVSRLGLSFQDLPLSKVEILIECGIFFLENFEVFLHIFNLVWNLIMFENIRFRDWLIFLGQTLNCNFYLRVCSVSFFQLRFERDLLASFLCICQ